MLNFAANLTTMFSEVPFPQRFSLAAEAGFTTVECLFPYALSPDELAGLLEKNRLRLVLFNLPAGKWEEGERGITALPGREREFRDGLERALVYAQAGNCSLLHAMAGLEPTGAAGPAMEQTYRDNLLLAADFFAEHGIQIVIEPISTGAPCPATSSTALARRRNTSSGSAGPTWACSSIFSMCRWRRAAFP